MRLSRAVSVTMGFELSIGVWWVPLVYLFIERGMFLVQVQGSQISIYVNDLGVFNSII